MRQQYLPALAPLYAGYTAWRGLVAEAAFPPPLHAQLFDEFSFCLPPNEQMLGYPVAGPDNDLRAGHRRYNFVWYRPASEERELPRLLTDESGRTHALSIPPPLIARDVVARMRTAGEQVLAPPFNAMLSLCAQPFLQPIYDLEVPRMAFGRVAILGDAAFVARPHVGAGVAKAAEDALALADALAGHDDVETALRQFEEARLGVGEKIIARARRLGAYVQADLKTRGRARLCGAASRAGGRAGRDRGDGFLATPGSATRTIGDRAKLCGRSAQCEPLELRHCPLEPLAGELAAAQRGAEIGPIQRVARASPPAMARRPHPRASARCRRCVDGRRRSSARAASAFSSAQARMRTSSGASCANARRSSTSRRCSPRDSAPGRR